VEWGLGILPGGLSNIVAVATGTSHIVAIVQDGSPGFVRQPAAQTPFRGSTFYLNAAAVGVPPLKYQWLFNGTELPGETNLFLRLADVQPSKNGDYSVIVSNSYGRIISSSTTLTTITCPPIITSRSPDDQLAFLGTN